MIPKTLTTLIKASPASPLPSHLKKGRERQEKLLYTPVVPPYLSFLRSGNEQRWRNLDTLRRCSEVTKDHFSGYVLRGNRPLNLLTLHISPGRDASDFLRSTAHEGVREVPGRSELPLSFGSLLAAASVLLSLNAGQTQYFCYCYL
ncbi:hypothetical protein Krac_11757 [Ktedonobacter racemifer DSM 44963]|uniref:Uncharacterized protein n=1 Tax=Ktedonobacter racemifer DSM 44963 TaxID=485913 RepID=D6TDL7_KTERA|nr:hypothetical protein Krac_11757 [Ktedonobacter racemifer DSM 44963]